MGAMEVLDTTGHTKIIWNADNADEVANARRTFTDLVGKRYRAFRVKKNGEEGEPLAAFDPSVESMILTPPIAGG